MSNRIVEIGIACLLALWFATAAYSQQVTLKANLLHAATGTPNLGVEFAVHPRWTVDLWGAYNLIDYKGSASFRHYLLQPEARYWFGEAFRGHFAGAHLLGGKFDIGGFGFIPSMKEHYFRGSLWGGGLTYGYQWKVGRRWRLEAALGVGFLTMTYDKYRCQGCAAMEARYKRNYLGPTRAALSLVYTLKEKKSTRTARLQAVFDAAYKEALASASGTPCPEADSLRQVLHSVEEQNRLYRITLDSLRALRRTVPDNEADTLQLESGRGVMYIQYPLNVTRVLPGFAHNRHELMRIDSLLHPLLTDSTVVIRSIRLTGYASPEGRYEHNVNLANRRIIGVMNHLSENYPILNQSVFRLTAIAEDWDGLAHALQASDKPYKADALRIIREVPLFDGRELKLMELRRGDPYREMLTDFFPRLRRTEFVIEWERKKSDKDGE